MKGVSTGSPERLTVIREIETEDHTTLEKYIHMLLDHVRAPNGEFFLCTLSEVDSAIEKGKRYVESDLQQIRNADELKSIEHTDVLIPASDEVTDIYSELRKAKQNAYFAALRVTCLESILKNRIGDNLGIADIATWKTFTMTRLDSGLVRETYPEVFETCSITSTSRRFALLRR
jgi:hypothetical protein